jgi:hypothetical protein
VRKRPPQPFTDTEADLASERHMAVHRYQEALAERVRRLQPDDNREGRAGREKVWTKTTVAWPGDESPLMPNFAALWAERTAVWARAVATVKSSLRLLLRSSLAIDPLWRRLLVYVQLRLGLDSLRRRIIAYLVILGILLLAYLTAIGITLWLLTRPATTAP